jgi:hypothetical protein
LEGERRRSMNRSGSSKEKEAGTASKEAYFGSFFQGAEPDASSAPFGHFGLLDRAFADNATGFPREGSIGEAAAFAKPRKPAKRDR